MTMSRPSGTSPIAWLSEGPIDRSVGHRPGDHEDHPVAGLHDQLRGAGAGPAMTSTQAARDRWGPPGVTPATSSCRRSAPDTPLPVQGAPSHWPRGRVTGSRVLTLTDSKDGLRRAAHARGRYIHAGQHAEPIGPYNHIAKVGEFITIGWTPPSTGETSAAGDDVESQARQILDSFAVMLSSVGSDLAHVVHVNIFLAQMSDFEAMNAAYVEKMGDHRPARTVIGVRELPKPGVLLTMNYGGSPAIESALAPVPWTPRDHRPERLRPAPPVSRSESHARADQTPA